jgi:hypothetical protein
MNLLLSAVERKLSTQSILRNIAIKPFTIDATTQQCQKTMEENETSRIFPENAEEKL